MGRARSAFVCSECGTQQARWLGRCPGCGAWQSLVEEPIGGGTAAPVDLLEVAATRAGEGGA
ncbi:MAG: DNA repair protein RadA, partial [Myxococcota bacterium]